MAEDAFVTDFEHIMADDITENVRFIMYDSESGKTASAGEVSKYMMRNIHVDPTLTEEGAAADAKAVGDKITDVKSDIDDNLLNRMVLVEPINKLNLSAITEGKILYKSGSYTTDANAFVSDYIPVSEGDIVYWKYNGTLTMYALAVCAFDSTKTAVSSAGRDGSSSSAYTVPSGIAFIRISFSNSDKTHAVVTINELATSYIAYEAPYYKIVDDFLTDETKALINEFSTDNYACSLPNQSLKMTVGISEKWYKTNMATPPTEFVNINAGLEYITKENDGFAFPNNSVLSSDIYFRWEHYNEALNLMSNQGGDPQYGRGRYVCAENLANCKLLVIGDSTVDQDTMTLTMLNYFVSKGKTLTLLGTLGDGSADNHNEGRAGWKATDYLTDKQYNGVVNPFYNPTSQTFDFNYYMTNQEYSTPDFVVIQLGINDLYYDYASAIETTWNAIKTIIDSIIAYNSSIKILMNLPTPPNADDSKLYNVGFLYRNAIIKYAQYAMNKMDKVYGGATKIRPTYCHLILDPSTDIRDDVHPTNDGYAKMGMEVINQINCWQNGH